MTDKQLRNMIKKRTEAGRPVRCIFCAKQIISETPEIDGHQTRRRELIVYHHKCYQIEYFGGLKK